MTLQTIKDLLHGTRGFALKMASGRVIDVPHPDFVALSPEGSSLVLVREGTRIEVIRINQIESIEMEDGTAAA
jgi:hypothetical protein